MKQHRHYPPPPPPPANTIPQHNAWFEIVICLVSQAGAWYRFWTQYHSLLDWLFCFPVAWILADLIVGLWHWCADSYRTYSATVNAIFFDNFQLHHVEPNLICQRPLFNVSWEVNVPSFCITVWQIIIVPVLQMRDHHDDDDETMMMMMMSRHHYLLVSSVAFWVSFTNQAHRWAHQVPRESVPVVVRFLQRIGILLSPERHRRHHYQDHLQDYCVLSGACNTFLNRIQLWRHLEWLVYWATGKESYAMLLMGDDKEALDKSPFGSSGRCRSRKNW